MKLVHRFRSDTRGSATHVETMIMAGFTVAVGLVMVSFGTTAGGRFTEMRGPTFTIASRDFEEHRTLASASASADAETETESWLAFLLRKGNAVARRVLAIATVAPLPWEQLGIGAEQLETHARFRAPIVSAISQTALFLLPALADAAIEAARDPRAALATLADPIGIARGMVMGTYDNAVDWKTMLLADDDDESALAASRIASGVVAARMLVIGGRPVSRSGVQRGLARAQLRSPRFIREALVKQQSAETGLIAFTRRSGITSSLQTREGRSSLGIAFIDNFKEREGTALLRDAIMRSKELGHEGRLRATIAEGSESFFRYRGFVPMFDDRLDVAQDLVLSKEAAETLLKGKLPRRADLDEWVHLPEYEAARIQRYAPELYEDVKRIILPGEPNNYDFLVQRVPGYRGPSIILDENRPRVLLDATATPDARVLKLANEVGERLFGRTVEPTWRFRDMFAFVHKSVSDEVEAKGAAVIYETQTRMTMRTRLGREVESRYSEEMTAVLNQLTVNDGLSRRFAGKYVVSHDPHFDLQDRSRYYRDIWDDSLSDEQSAALDAVEHILRGAANGE